MKQLYAALAVGALTISTAAADDWPSRPVRMVNTFAAGGTADVLTRLVADHLTVAFKQHIGATQPLRTGAYSKTLTFTLSTTTP